MTRFTLALVASFALAAAVRSADLPVGTWAANVDGEKGDFVVKEVKDGKFTGVLLGTDVSGFWNGKTVTFLSGKDTYEAHLVAEPGEKGQTKYTLTGMRSQMIFNQNRAGGGGAIHVAKVGWYAQMTAATPAPTGFIKAEVRGTLVYEKNSAYVLVTRKVGATTEETRVWVGVEDWKASKAALSALDKKEVIVTGTLVQLAIRERDSVIPVGALYFAGKFEITQADTPK